MSRIDFMRWLCSDSPENSRGVSCERLPAHSPSNQARSLGANVYFFVVSLDLYTFLPSAGTLSLHPTNPTHPPTMKMHRLLTIAGSLAGFLNIVWSPSMLVAAEESASPKTAAPNPHLEPKALDELKRMSATLAAVNAFTFRTSNTVEVPADTGQFITLFANSEIALRRPNKLRARVTGEVPNFEFTYDGSNIDAFAANNNVYSVAKAPGTIDAMLPFIEKETGIHFASGYVLYSDPYAVLDAKTLPAPWWWAPTQSKVRPVSIWRSGLPASIGKSGSRTEQARFPGVW